MMKVLVTGAAGFIGFHLVTRLLENAYEVVGLDSINDYYSVELKYARLEKNGIFSSSIRYNTLVQSDCWERYRFVQLNLEDKDALFALFAQERFDYVCNLAAQAGVRYSIDNPFAYLKSNLDGFLVLLEACRHYPVVHLLYASSSSVYGMNKKYPYSVEDRVDHPVSLYAATKKSNELMAHAYSHLYAIPTTGLRFFTVYGPWGRPDMAPMLFARAILKNDPIKLFNWGRMFRDFTYINDIVDGLLKLIPHIPQGKKQSEKNEAYQAGTSAPYKVYNIGGGRPIALLDFVSTLEQALGKEAEKQYLPMQPGDVYRTCADVTDLEREIQYSPQTRIEEGIKYFADWYLDYYK